MGSGKNGTAEFLSGIIGALPPLHELARNAGLDLPAYLASSSGRPRNPMATA